MRLAPRIAVLEHVVRPIDRRLEAERYRRRNLLLWKLHPEYLCTVVDEYAFQLCWQGRTPAVRKMEAKINRFVEEFDRKHGL